MRRLDRRAQERMREEEEGLRPVTDTLFEHQRVHLEAELTWTRTVLERVERGTFRATMKSVPVQAPDDSE